MRTINKLIVHCSASDFPLHDNVETIYAWHVGEKNFNDIGYHFIITKNGVIHWCRPMSEPGAHCKGHNQTSIAICLTGLNKFSQEQKHSFKKLVYNLIDLFNLTDSDVYGHNEFNSKKTCPNFNIKEFLA